MDPLILAGWHDLVLINKKKQLNFAVPMDYWVKMKENENIDKYSNLARELKTKQKL